jgi:hypothetical protein
VDDFAFKKRYSYGSVMVNLKTHKIVDIIPSRDTNDVKKWLDTFPNLKIISRDGAFTYASAATNSHPSAIQISDRFHLLKNLSEAIGKYIVRTFPSRVEVPAVTIATPEMQALYDTANRSMRIKYARQKRMEGLTISDIALLLHSSPATISKYLKIPEDKITEDKKISKELQHQLALEQKQKEVNEARALYKQGYAVEKIGVLMHHASTTIKAYLSPSYCIVNGHYDTRIPGKLAPYEYQVIELRCQGYTYEKIHDIISAAGYCGSVASLRMFMQKERAHKNTQCKSRVPESEYIQRKSLCQLIYRKLENIYGLSQEQYEAVIKKYPLIGKLYITLREFQRIVFSQKTNELKSWISETATYDIPEITSFLDGIRKDIDAVENGISYQYNNGLAEGSVNKIKLIKRIMYGRNSFNLLKAKVLLNELYS